MTYNLEGVIDYFYTYRDNESPVIAKFFGLPVAVVEKYLDRELSKKKNYLGAKIPTRKILEPLNDIKHRNITCTIQYLNGDLFGHYNSLSDGCKAMGYSGDYISRLGRNKTSFKTKKYIITKTYD